MRIAYLAPNFPPNRGGMGNVAYNFAQAIQEKGYEVAVFTPDYRSNRQKIKTAFKTVKIKPVFKFGSSSAFVPQVFFYLQKFDIIHLHYPFFGGAETVILKKLFNKKIKLVVHFHMDSAARGLKGFFFAVYRKIMIPLIIRLSSRITCASLDYVENSILKKYYKKNKKKFIEINFGVNEKNFCFKNKSLNKKIFDILFVGGLDSSYHTKGLNDLFSALKKLSDRDLALTIIGEGNKKKYYQDLSRKQGINNKVFFTQNIDDKKLVDYLHQSDVLILPSNNKGEAFGLVLLEAMSTGTPVIASRLPGVRTVFKDGEQGLFFQPGDVNDLAEKIEFLMNNRERGAKMGQKGRGLTENNYLWSIAGEKLNRLYKEL